MNTFASENNVKNITYDEHNVDVENDFHEQKDKVFNSVSNNNEKQKTQTTRSASGC